MNTADLLAQMQRLDLTEMELMNELNEAGLISDHCVRLWDIAEPDITRSVRWLHPKRIRYGADGNPNLKVLR